MFFLIAGAVRHGKMKKERALFMAEVIRGGHSLATTFPSFLEASYDKAH